jgi:NAD(P)-dependent dehydrogenase (short-subunit alcohol dehydrogenase family)
MKGRTVGSGGFDRFENAVAVVTGGSSGIGRGIAEALIARGTKVAICARDGDKAAAVASQIGAWSLQVDVSDLASVQRMASAVLDRWGKVNIVCNNAGVGPMAAVQDMTIADWRWMLDVNLWGVIHGVTTFLPHLMANSDGGHIVNTASLAGLWSVPGLAAYSSAKAAVVALTETLHQELAASSELVGATVFCPGPVRSEIKSSLRGRPEGDAGALADVDIGAVVPPEIFLDPARCGELVIDAIRNNHLYLLTHPQWAVFADARFNQLKAAFDRVA